jgi:hypothetical protein
MPPTAASNGPQRLLCTCLRSLSTYRGSRVPPFVGPSPPVYRDDDEERPIYGTQNYGTRRRVRVADAAKRSPHLVYRVPARWKTPISPCKHSGWLRHQNWEECCACFHAGRSEAWRGRRSACSKCPRSLHSSSTSACIQNGTPPLRPQNSTRVCSYCQKYELQKDERAILVFVLQS